MFWKYGHWYRKEYNTQTKLKIQIQNLSYK